MVQTHSPRRSKEMKELLETSMEAVAPWESFRECPIIPPHLKPSYCYANPEC